MRMRSRKVLSIRRRAAVNSFKERLLGALHIPGQPQTLTALDAMARLSNKEVGSITERTWQSWLSKGHVAPQVGKLGVLDRLACHLEREGQADSTSYYRDAACGGLVACLVAPTKLRDVGNLICERAGAYEPASALHLHLDAIEVAGLTVGFADVVGPVVRRVAAGRLLQVLHSRWSPRGGSLYGEWLTKGGFGCVGEAHGPQDDFVLRSSFGPNWRNAGIAEDIPEEHIYKLLFALAADASFLRRHGIDVWAMDAVTAALALFAFAWSDKGEAFPIRSTPERCIYSALEAVFLRGEPIIDLEWEIRIGMEQTPAVWNAETWSVLMDGRQAYARIAERLGFSVGEIREIVAETMRAEPHQYQAGEFF